MRRARRAGRGAARGGAFGAGAAARPTRTPSSARGCRWRAWRATSRRRCSGRPAIEPGLGKNTYGTGSFVLHERRAAAAAGASPGCSTTVAWGIGGRVDYALEASVFVTGAAVQWLRDGLGIISRRRPRPRRWPASLDSNDGVYFVPALTGLGSPHWDPYARGTIVGLTRGTGRAHLARAALEAIAYQTVDAVRGDGGGFGRAARGAARRRRRGRERLADAVPGRRARAARWSCRRWPRRPRSARPTWPASGRARGPSSDVRSLWREAARYEPRMGDDERESLLRGLAAGGRALAGLGGSAAIGL